LTVGFSSFASLPCSLQVSPSVSVFFSPLNRIYDSVKCGGVLQIRRR
jgi:hypothetical protein